MSKSENAKKVALIFFDSLLDNTPLTVRWTEDFIIQDETEEQMDNTDSLSEQGYLVAFGPPASLASPLHRILTGLAYSTGVY